MADDATPRDQSPRWDPSQYLKFGGLRLRPALDLLARIGAEAPATVVDLGCGPGNLAPALTGRWPEAVYVGVDSSAEMLAEARAEHPGHAWVEADVGAWAPDAPVDVLYSNACLQWLEDHASLFPRLVSFLAPGGWLAVQMPRNHAAPSHQAIIETVEDGPWAGRLRPLLRPSPVAPPEAYYDILVPHVATLDIWETEYLQTLDGDNAVAEWTKGSALKPFLDALDDAEREAFFAAYSARTRRAYPERADGRTLLPFRRQFIVAQAAA